MNRHAPTPRTLTQIRGDLLMLLTNATDKAFATLTLDELCRRYSRRRREVIAADFEAARSARGLV